MNVDVDTLLEKWADARNNIAALEKKVDNYKKIMKQYFLKNNIQKYENDFFKVKQSTQTRSFITKKNVPNEVWEQYSKPQQIEFLSLLEKKSTRNKV